MIKPQKKTQREETFGTFSKPMKMIGKSIKVRKHVKHNRFEHKNTRLYKNKPTQYKTIRNTSKLENMQKQTQNNYKQPQTLQKPFRKHKTNKQQTTTTAKNMQNNTTN